MSTTWALDRLGRPELSSQAVGQALKLWQQIAARSRADLNTPHNDWVEFIGPMVRDELEAALCGLSRRQAAPLRALVLRADELFVAKTLPNPTAEPTRPWWARRRQH